MNILCACAKLIYRSFNITEIFCFVLFCFITIGFVPRPKNHDRKKWSNLGSLQEGGKGGVIPLLTWQPILGDEVTCDQLHCIPYRWIAPGVSQAFLTKPLKNGSAAQVLWGVYGSCDNLFFSGKKGGGHQRTQSHLRPGLQAMAQTHCSFFSLSVARPFPKRNFRNFISGILKKF